MQQGMTVIGMMSGTSMDGIDIALVTTDGERLFARGQSLSYPYTGEERERLREATHAAWRVWGRDGKGKTPDPKDMTLLEAVEDEVTRRHAAAIADFLNAFGISREEVKLIGFHGQTVFHDAARRITHQLGSGPLLAKLIGIDVMHDFRTADVAAGGQGAPLVPIYHRAVSEELGLERPVAIVNIGGVANITFIGSDGSVLAFDVGPGNALIDDWVHRHTGADYDKNGALSLKGKVDAELLARLMAHPFFARKPPKSLDRYDFPPLAAESLSLEDGAATLVALTAKGVAKAIDFLPARPKLWVLAGGGARNPALVQSIGKLVGAQVISADEVGWSSEHMEAEAFGFLAVRAARKLPLTFPGTTGAPRPLTGGRLARAPRR